jgi:hypothetical protein
MRSIADRWRLAFDHDMTIFTQGRTLHGECGGSTGTRLNVEYDLIKK